jgi:hypothetical protein
LRYISSRLRDFPGFSLCFSRLSTCLGFLWQRGERKRIEERGEGRGGEGRWKELLQVDRKVKKESYTERCLWRRLAIIPPCSAINLAH